MNRQLHCIIVLMLAPPISALSSEIAFIGYDKGYWQVYTMGGHGSELKKISNSNYDKNKVSWYPDGEHLLVNGSQGELVKLHLKTAAEQRVDFPFKNIADAVVSPDGTPIAFSTAAAAPFDQNDIWVANADGGEPLKLNSPDTGSPKLTSPLSPK